MKKIALILITIIFSGCVEDFGGPDLTPYVLQPGECALVIDKKTGESFRGIFIKLNMSGSYFIEIDGEIRAYTHREAHMDKCVALGIETTSIQGA